MAAKRKNMFSVTVKHTGGTNTTADYVIGFDFPDELKRLGLRHMANVMFDICRACRMPFPSLLSPEERQNMRDWFAEPAQPQQQECGAK